MRIVIQRVKKASVMINKNIYSSICEGLLCYVGFCDSDTNSDFEWALKKIINLKLFNNQFSLEDIKGQLLIVSQFTLFGSIRKGNKPSWSRAAKPSFATFLYDNFIKICEEKLPKRVQTGVFGADMQIELINDGPLTILIDTKNKE